MIQSVFSMVMGDGALLVEGRRETDGGRRQEVAFSCNMNTLIEVS